MSLTAQPLIHKEENGRQTGDKHSEKMRGRRCVPTTPLGSRRKPLNSGKWCEKVGVKRLLVICYWLKG